MKTIKYLFAFVTVILFFSACAFDNYDEPTTVFTGQLKMEGVDLNTRHNVLFRLYQYKEDGYIANNRPIDVWVNQEGKYNALLFPGRYKMVVNEASGINYIHDWNDFPKNSTGNLDTLYFTLEGNKKLDFSITPYFKINDFQAFFQNDSIISTFSIQKLTNITETPIVGFRSVGMYLSPTIHVNNETQLFFTSTGVTAGTPVRIRGHLREYYSNTHYKNNYREYVYVRIAVSLRVSAQEFIYSKIIKVEGIPQETIQKFK
jgi:hypothetical protein